MNWERDKYLTEKMGKCWHGDEPIYAPRVCSICGFGVLRHPSYSTPEGFFILLNWGKEQKWWELFIDQRGWVEPVEQGIDFIETTAEVFFLEQDLIHPDRFADAIEKFLKEEQA